MHCALNGPVRLKKKVRVARVLGNPLLVFGVRPGTAAVGVTLRFGLRGERERLPDEGDLRGRKTEMSDGDPHDLIRTMPAEGNRPAGLRAPRRP